MSEARDTLFRYLTMLQLIPRFPGRIATPVLKEKLAERGFKIDTRSYSVTLARNSPLSFRLAATIARSLTAGILIVIFSASYRHWMYPAP